MATQTWGFSDVAHLTVFLLILVALVTGGFLRVVDLTARQDEKVWVPLLHGKVERALRLEIK